MAEASGHSQPSVGIKRKDDVGNLGWLAGTTLPPQKKRDIDGVSGASIVDLQAQLYRVQEHVRNRKEGVADPSEKHVQSRAGSSIARLMEKKNAGVEARDTKDKLEVKSAADRTAECYAALERKAKLYERLARGELDDEEAEYSVDFLRKGTLEDEARDMQPGTWNPEQPVDTAGAAVSGSGAMMSEDMRRERERRQWEADMTQQHEQESIVEERRRLHKEAILDLSEQTRENRQRAQAQKQLKEDKVQSTREKLKEAFLKKQLGRLASGQTKAGHK